MVLSPRASVDEPALDLRSPPHSADRVRFASSHYLPGLDEADDEAPTQRISAIRLGPADDSDEDAGSTHTDDQPPSPAPATPSAPRTEGVYPATSPVAHYGPRAGVPSTASLANKSRQAGSADPLAAGPPDLSPSFNSFAALGAGRMDARPSIPQTSQRNPLAPPRQIADPYMSGSGPTGQLQGWNTGGSGGSYLGANTAYNAASYQQQTAQQPLPATFYSGGQAVGVYHPPSGWQQPPHSVFSGGNAQGEMRPPQGWVFTNTASGAPTYLPASSIAPSGPMPHTIYSGGDAAGPARPPPGWAFHHANTTGPSGWNPPPQPPSFQQTLVQTAPHTSSAHLTKTNIVERVPKHLMDAVRARPWAYQPLSRWTSRALEDGKVNGGATHSGAPSSYLGYSHDDALLGYPEFLEATANLNSAIAVASAATASVFRIHWAAIEARYSPSMWPALRTYDLRVRLIHVGDSVRDLLQFDTPLFASVLIEDHEAIYQPPAAEHPAYPTAAATAPNGNTSGGSDFGLPSIDSTPLLVDGADLPPTQQGSGLSSSSLASWLDGIYNGLSAVAPALVAAGAGSSAQLAELAYLGDSTLDDFIAMAARDPAAAGQLTSFRQVILKNGIRSRFGVASSRDTVGTAV